MAIQSLKSVVNWNIKYEGNIMELSSDLCSSVVVSEFVGGVSGVHCSF